MQKGDTQNGQEGLIDVGNKICPVSGGLIDDSMMKATYEYEGKTYNFCCAMCIDAFKADPEQYIKNIEE
ncbi:MAG: YHS domain-containing protein [Candidatus Omnitrophica bacterium]|nr:YHS domain-containing protein [Candidatus Omnitrophota bacterium]